MIISYQQEKLGFSTSAYQIEGGWNEDGKGLSIWDVFSRETGHIKDGSTGEMTCDSYHKWKEDIEWLQKLGASYYRFSFSWSRILPNGDLSIINEKGLQYYETMIDELLHKNITPLVTLFHWDLPQELQEKYGGWENDHIYQDFLNYACLCFSRFSKKITHWITINEPYTFSVLGYGNGLHAPGKKEPYSLPYWIGYRLLKAHVLVYHAFHETFEGNISIALNADCILPKNPTKEEDLQAAERGNVWRMGWFADPLFFGSFPSLMTSYLTETRLPSIENPEKWKNTLDFFALNHYTTLLAEPSSSSMNTNNVFLDDRIVLSFPPSSSPSASSWLHSYPEGIYHIIQWIHQRYWKKKKENFHDLPLFITEFGISNFPQDPLQDNDRIQYLNKYIKNIEKASLDLSLSIPVYCIWSLMDNFEWASGYSERFGILYVNFSDPQRTRIPKASAISFLQTKNSSIPHLSSSS
ncbi:MAG: glycosyl hydrolase family protein [Planctomycetia bacterium]|nr:glycosyl hydrolase family protein [Planctomycetia bacterium]